MLKIGQNWGKIANYPSNVEQRFAPLFNTFFLKQQNKDIQCYKPERTIRNRRSSFIPRQYS